MAYRPPILKPVPFGKLCDYGCRQPAIHWFKRPKKWCCSKTANACPVKKEENAIARKERNIIEMQFKDKPKDLDYIRALYPQVIPDIIDGTLRYNKKSGKIEARCTHFECKLEWFEIPQNHIGFRKWALSPSSSGGGTKGGDGYRYYCSDNCRDKCIAHGKTGAMIYKEIVLSHMIDWEEDEEWYGADVSQADKNLWRETCLVRDGFLCVRCGEPAVHVHHEHAVKTHPMEVVDPINGISTCLRCHYDHFHKRGSVCSLPNLIKKVCFTIKNGVPLRPVRKTESPSPELLTI
jgi:hypothetical protein